MKNIIGAAVLLPLVSSLIVIIISAGNTYWVSKSYAFNRNANWRYDNYNKSCKSVFPAEEETCKIHYPTCYVFDHQMVIEITE